MNSFTIVSSVTFYSVGRFTPCLPQCISDIFACYSDSRHVKTRIFSNVWKLCIHLSYEVALCSTLAHTVCPCVRTEELSRALWLWSTVLLLSRGDRSAPAVSRARWMSAAWVKMCFCPAVLGWFPHRSEPSTQSWPGGTITAAVCRRVVANVPGYDPQRGCGHKTQLLSLFCHVSRVLWAHTVCMVYPSLKQMPTTHRQNVYVDLQRVTHGGLFCFLNLFSEGEKLPEAQDAVMDASHRTL